MAAYFGHFRCFVCFLKLQFLKEQLGGTYCLSDRDRARSPARWLSIITGQDRAGTALRVVCFLDDRQGRNCSGVSQQFVYPLAAERQEWTKQRLQMIDNLKSRINDRPCPQRITLHQFPRLLF